MQVLIWDVLHGNMQFVIGDERGTLVCVHLTILPDLESNLKVRLRGQGGILKLVKQSSRDSRNLSR